MLDPVKLVSPVVAPTKLVTGHDIFRYDIAC